MAKRRHLGEFEQLVLLAVWQLGAGAYGASVQRELEKRTGRRRTISAIYVTLMRLEKQGYVTSELSDPEPVRGGKAKRCFALSSLGVESLRQSRAQLEAMWEGLEAERP